MATCDPVLNEKAKRQDSPYNRYKRLLNGRPVATWTPILDPGLVLRQRQARLVRESTLLLEETAYTKQNGPSHGEPNM